MSVMMENILIALVCGGLTVLLCWLAYINFGKGNVTVEGCKAWGVKKEIIAYKCAAGDTTSYGRLFNEVRSITPSGRVYVLFYNGSRLSGQIQARSLYAIGFPVKCDFNEWMKQGFKLFLLQPVELGVLASYPLHYRFSESLAVRKTYPVLYRYIRERKLCAHPVIEVYDYNKKEVTFIRPLLRQICYYVPEAFLLE